MTFPSGYIKDRLSPCPMPALGTPGALLHEYCVWLDGDGHTEHISLQTLITRTKAMLLLEHGIDWYLGSDIEYSYRKWIEREKSGM